jgi:N-acetylmuramoyl-L-alanine amidase
MNLTSAKAQHIINMYNRVHGGKIIKVDNLAGSITDQAYYQITKSYPTKHKKYQLSASSYDQLKFVVLKSIKKMYPLLVEAIFAMFIDAGHGALNVWGKYTTAGKYMNFNEHGGKIIPAHKDNWYYEGRENRIVAEMAIHNLTKAGIPTIRTYDPTKDTSLRARVDLVNEWLRKGYYGGLWSCHSNAISLDLPNSKLDNTQGLITFTTKGETLSDKIALQYHTRAEEVFGEEWVRERKHSKGGPDYEANFMIIRETDTQEYLFFAILNEFGFHTSWKDVQKIMMESNRRQRAELICEIGLFSKKIMEL